MNTHRTYVKRGEFNGKLIEFKITEQWTYDDLSVEGTFDFGDEEENKEYLHKFVTGEFVNLVIGVKAEALGCEGTDLLCGCHVATITADEDITECIEVHDMVVAAIDDCRAAISNQITTLIPFFANLPR
jgi:hypothetical protein